MVSRKSSRPRKFSVLLPRRQDGFNGLFADALDGAQSESNGITFDGEVVVAVVNIRREDRYSVIAAVIHVADHIVLVIGYAERRAHMYSTG